MLRGARGDVEIHGAAPVVIQAKSLFSQTAQAFNENVYEAVAQLRGEGGELPLPNSVRVAVIQLPPQHALESHSKQGLIDSLRSSPADYSDLLRAKDHGWDEIEVRTQKQRVIITPKDIAP